MKSIEMERVFLLNKLPTDLNEHKSIVIQVGDFYESNSMDALKIRQKGNSYELIKKDGDSAHKRTEHTIIIKKQEFDILWKSVNQKHKKRRFFYPLGNNMCEIDFYLDKLKGYVRAEVEFKDKQAMASFNPPSWFGQEISRFNHLIHDDLGIITFEDMKERYAEIYIKLVPLLLSF